MAWGRKLEIAVGPQPRKMDEKTAVLISDLECKFTVKRTMLFEDGSAEVVVFNLSESSRNRISVPGQFMSIRVGYESSGLGTLFNGQVSKVTHSHTGPDWITTIRGVCGRPMLDRLQASVVAVSYVAGTSLAQVAFDLAQGLGMTVFGQENIKDILLRNGYHYSGRVSAQYAWLRNEVSARQIAVYIDDQQMVFYKTGSRSNLIIMNLTPSSGLLSVKPTMSAAEQALAINGKSKKFSVKPEELRDRYQIKTLLLWQLVPNAMIRVSSETIRGHFIVEQLEAKGDNMGGEWSSTVEATSTTAEGINAPQ